LFFYELGRDNPQKEPPGFFHKKGGDKMVDLSQKTIQELFFNQIKRMSVDNSFDVQCSEWWLR